MLPAHTPEKDATMPKYLVICAFGLFAFDDLAAGMDFIPDACDLTTQDVFAMSTRDFSAQVY
mgnify:CR=1 FL=1